MGKLSIIATTLAALVPVVARAQAPTGALAISGSSTMRDWTCREDAMAATATAPGRPGAPGATPLPSARPGSRAAQPAHAPGVTLTFPVGAIDCSDPGMNEQLQQALKASRYPTITFGLPAAEVARALAAGAQPVQVTGELTIAGETRPVQTRVTVTPTPGHDLQVRGEQSLRMTNFGVKPPVLMLGLLKVRDLVHVAFDVVLRAARVGRPGRAPGGSAAPGLRAAARP